MSLLAWLFRVSRRDTIDRYYVVPLPFGAAIFLHHIKQSDPIEVMHTHPWSFLSLIAGAYYEDRPGCARQLRRWFNFCFAGQPHRVTLIRPIWTILFHGLRRCQWAVTDDHGRVLETEPWTGTDSPNRTSYR